MRALGLVHKDPNGKTRPIKYDILLVPPSLEDMATRICNSQYLPGSANNDINPLYGKIKVVVWARLETASDGTDASAYWYLLDSSRKDETLQCLFAERPSLDAPEEVYENKDWNYTLDYFYAIGFGYRHMLLVRRAISPSWEQ
jgi:phage major head subunit gpT-like protein